MPILTDIRNRSTRDLLAAYVEILDELVRRNVIRTRNAPAGDLAERVVAAAYSGELAANSSKSWDVRASDGRLLQVKSRVIGPDTRRSQVFSPFRTFDFDACVFVIFDARDYSISNATELPAESVRGLSRRSEWVAGNRVRVFADLLNAPGAVDVTALLQDSLAAL